MHPTARVLPRARLAGAIAALALTTPVGAQPGFFQSSVLSYAAYRTNGAGTISRPCGSTYVALNGPGTAGQSCQGFGASFDWLADATAGATGAHARVGGTGLSTSPTGYATWGAVGGPRWADRLSITSGNPASIGITVAWDGAMGVDVAAPPGVDVVSSAQLAYGFFAAPAGQINTATYAQVLKMATDDGGGLHQRTSFHDVQSFTLYTGGGAYLDFDFLLTMQASALLTENSGPPGSSFDASAFADATQLGRITSLTFYDGFGQDITSSVQYSFLNGTLIYPSAPATTAPEPATWASLGTGLLALAVRRRRRASASTTR
ncbi:PEP motif putative anchor domain protein [Gemmatirosa kalamazoonensis]|uniref:PEP motif putative anchor domain protein n=1 Tax=Gemmatirosa kalamazoonensis TaxID=861299 RepID=W0RN11_9BACT|nr:PEP-CTERM sorting domain-containing protein [Gemmatirosa kalamazoonensis]AHG91685.1 PEP motif putative anchor domain protein [Gemmatirosa kalamazoonensis]